MDHQLEGLLDDVSDLLYNQVRDIAREAIELDVLNRTGHEITALQRTRLARKLQHLVNFADVLAGKISDTDD